MLISLIPLCSDFLCVFCTCLCVSPYIFPFKCFTSLPPVPPCNRTLSLFLLYLISFFLSSSSLHTAGYLLSIMKCSSIPKNQGCCLGIAFLSLTLGGDWTSWGKLIERAWLALLLLPCCFDSPFFSHLHTHPAREKQFRSGTSRQVSRSFQVPPNFLQKEAP